MLSASSVLHPQRRRRWITDIRPDVDLPNARFERLITTRIRSPFLGSSSSTASSDDSEVTNISLFSVSEIKEEFPRRIAERKRAQKKSPTQRPNSSVTPFPRRPASIPSRATSAGSQQSSRARAAAKMADKKQLAHEYLEKLVRQLSNVSGVGDPGYKICSEFIDTDFSYIERDFGRRVWYPQNLRLTPKLTAVIRSEVLRRLDIEHFPELQHEALLCLDTTQPTVTETRLELLLRWLDHLPHDDEEKETILTQTPSEASATRNTLSPDNSVIPETPTVER